MTLIQIGALRFHGLDADIVSLPVGNVNLFGAIFDAVDTIRKFQFDGTAWVEFVKGTGEANEMANVGVGTGLIFRNKIGVTFNLKSLIGGTNVTITDNADDITIATTGASPLTTKGDLFGFDTDDQRIPVGTNGQILTANSVPGVGVEWQDQNQAGHIIEDETVPLPQQVSMNFNGDLVVATDDIPNSATDVKINTGFAAKGDLLSQGVTLLEILPVGTDGQRLEADSVEASGLKWVDNVGEDNLGANVGAGTGLVFRDKTGVTLNFKTLIGGTNVTVTDNVDDITIDATGGGASPLTTKGDLFGFSTVDARLPVGTQGQILSVDSVEVTGLKWIENTGGTATEGIAVIESPDGTFSKLVMTNDGRLELEPTTTPAGINPITTSLELANTTTQLDPSNPLDTIMWQQVLDANNSVSRSKMKIDGIVREVRWF